MQPSKISVVELFEHREQYLIPLFQRGYVWTLADQIQPLWEDLADRMDALSEHRENAQKVGGAEKLAALQKHFLGAIVVGSPDSSNNENVPTREVIDGQQRITTFQLMLIALRDLASALNDEGLDHDLRILTSNAGNYRSKSDRLKVYPTNAGREEMLLLANAGSFKSVATIFPVKGPNKESVQRPLMVQAYMFFYCMLKCLLQGKRFDDPAQGEDGEGVQILAHAVSRSIERDGVPKTAFDDLPLDLAAARLLIETLERCFQIMRLQLDSEDDPQIIFETLNARGARLLPSDLIRNFVFLRAARSKQAYDVDELYNAYWKEFDEKPDVRSGQKGTKFWRKEERQGRFTSSRLDLLLYHYVSLRKCEDIKVGHVFEEFKQWWENSAGVIGDELARITALAKFFETFVAPDQDTRFGLFCRRIRLLDTATLTPLVFHLLEHNGPTEPDFLQAIRDLESYLVRRFICGFTPKGYNRIFLNRVLGEMVIEGQANAATLRAKLLELKGDSQKWPDDTQFKSSWIYHRLYQGSSTKKVRAVLEGLELQARTSIQEFIPRLETLSVEHVMPQKWTPERYPIKLGSAEAETRKQLIHSIGNLTLVTPGFNSSLSNEAFNVKRPEIAHNSSLLLNAYFQQPPFGDIWDEAAIVARAETLLPLALKAWPYPTA